MSKTQRKEGWIVYNFTNKSVLEITPRSSTVLRIRELDKEEYEALTAPFQKYILSFSTEMPDTLRHAQQNSEETS
jgi:glycyl-tRNA synthetase (class II)